MEHIPRMIRQCTDYIQKFKDTIEVFEWLQAMEDLPGSASLTVMHGPWMDVLGIDEWKALRKTLGRHLITTYFHTLERSDKGQIKVSYALSIKPFTHEEVEAATWDNGYISEIDLTGGHSAPVVHCIICVNPGPECKKVITGTKQVDVVKWICE